MSKQESPWFAPLSPPTWPTLEGDVEVDVVVVGGGICGLTVADLLAAEGTSVAVVEASRIGRGTTGCTTGKVTSQHSLIYHTLIERHGIEAASDYAAANQQRESSHRSSPGGPRSLGELERWARRHFDVESFEYRWSAEDFEPVNRMPFVGRATLMRRTYVATGFNKWGLTNATAAAHMLRDLLTGRPNAWTGTFDPRCWGDTKTLMQMSQLNFHVAKRFVLDRLIRLAAPDLGNLEPGEGGLVRVNGRTVAAYREPDGRLHGVSATCSHLACTVQWNRAENSWDCPCHGSRFSVDGQVLDGPATRPLERFEMP